MPETRHPRLRVARVVLCSVAAVALTAAACGSDKPAFPPDEDVADEVGTSTIADSAPKLDADTDDQIEPEPERGFEPEPEPVTEPEHAAGSEAAQDSWDAGAHQSALDALLAWDVFDGTGCADGSGFCADEPVKNWELAVWLVRVLDGEEPSEVAESSFADVDGDAWWAAHVERLAELQVAVGCAVEPLRFCPDEEVSRAQMAPLLVRGFWLSEASPAGFEDVSRDDQFASGIDALVQARIVVGCSSDPLRYCPERSVTRAEMATYLARALGLIEAPRPEHSQTFDALAVGGLHACGLLVNGSLLCWGNNDWGQSETPPGTFRALSAGELHNCGVRVDSSVACWGDGSLGQTDAPAGVFDTVAAGAAHTCALTGSASVMCWGDGSLGQTDAPAGVFDTVAAGGAHTCGVRVDGSVMCWGDNSLGQTDVPPGSYGSLSAGGAHTCGVRVDGSVMCWGDNSLGQTDAPPGFFAAVAAGATHSCTLTEGGGAVCWGDRLRE